MQEEYYEKEFEDLPDEEYYTCYACNWGGRDAVEQESLFDTSVWLCPVCGELISL